MKEKLFTLAIVQVCIYTLFGCSLNPDYTSVDRHGDIIEVDKENDRILVDDKDDGQIWVDISNLQDKDKFIKPLEVIVWLEGNVKEGKPQEGVAKRVDIVK